MKILCLNFPRRSSISRAEPRAIVALAVRVRQNIFTTKQDKTSSNQPPNRRPPRKRASFTLPCNVLAVWALRIKKAGWTLVWL